MNVSNSDRLIELIGNRNLLQKKYVEKNNSAFDEEEIEAFDMLISYYIEQGETVESLADLYLAYIDDLMEERYFFVQHGCYRYASAEEVHGIFYENQQYMKIYMVGLALSTFLLTSHRAYMKWYKDCIRKYCGGGKAWLEVGPGHGVYFTYAVNHTEYDCYYGIDLSQTAVDMSRSIIGKQVNGQKQVVIEKKDFLELSDDKKYDAIIAGEVLEHVEDPGLFLRKMKRLAKQDAFIYVTTAINCLQKDHIYLFQTIEEVETLIRDSGLKIADRLYVPTNGYSLEKAVRKAVAINVAYVLARG